MMPKIGGRCVAPGHWGLRVVGHFSAPFIMTDEVKTIRINKTIGLNSIIGSLGGLDTDPSPKNALGLSRSTA